MGGDSEHRRAEPHGFVGHEAADVRTRWRSVMGLLFGAREDIDQVGLLAGRNLDAAPRRTRRDDGGAAADRD